MSSTKELLLGFMGSDRTIISEEPKALTTGTARLRLVAVTAAFHLFNNCINTHPTGEQPPSMRILKNVQTYFLYCP